MYFYLFINIGGLVGQIGMAYAEKFVGFWLAYTLPTIIFFLCPIVLWFGKNRYVTSPPTGSVLAATLRLWRFAAKGRWSWNPVEMIRLMTADDFWENAKPSKQPIETKPKWMIFDDTWVDEVRRGMKACTVFLWYPIYCASHNSLIWLRCSHHLYRAPIQPNDSKLDFSSRCDGDAWCPERCSVKLGSICPGYLHPHL